MSNGVDDKTMRLYEETLARLVLRVQAVETTVSKIHKVLDMAFSRFEVLTQNPLFMSLMGATSAAAKSKNPADSEKNCSTS